MQSLQLHGTDHWGLVDSCVASTCRSTCRQPRAGAPCPAPSGAPRRVRSKSTPSDAACCMQPVPTPRYSPFHCLAPPPQSLDNPPELQSTPESRHFRAPPTRCDAAGRRRSSFRPCVLGAELGQAEGGSFSSGRRHADPLAASVRQGTAGGVPGPVQGLCGCCKGHPVNLCAHASPLPQTGISRNSGLSS